MLRYKFLLPLVLLLPGLAFAETVVAKRTVRSHSTLLAEDFLVRDEDTPGAIEKINDIVGLESRKVLYQGRPVFISDVGPAAIIERNQIITLVYASGGLTILAEARSLERAGIGDVIRVMNIGSRKTVNGVVGPDGTVNVGTTSPMGNQ